MAGTDKIDSQSMALFGRFYHRLLEEGVYIGPSGYEVGFMSAAHDNQDIEEAIHAFTKALDYVFG